MINTSVHFQITKLRESIKDGELVDQSVVMKYIESHITDNMNKEGIILDGFPRDMGQAMEFEARVRIYAILGESSYRHLSRSNISFLIIFSKLFGHIGLFLRLKA